MKIKILVILILVLVAGVTGWRIYKLFTNSESKQSQEEQAKPQPSINGDLVESDKAKLRPIAVVIENHSDARPQSGLSDAEIVYETLAEGGITRFLAIFQTRDPKSIGPVRSARPYFNFLADLWQTPLVHAGGSKQALSELSSGVYKNLFDVNEFYYGDYFFREKTRSAPHNLYTSLAKQRELLTKKQQQDWTPLGLWSTKTTPTDQLKTEVTSITLPFSQNSYEARFEFDQTTSTYKRKIAGSAALDNNTNNQIASRNLLVMLADISPVPDDELGTMRINLNGSGPCYLFKAGIFVECKWSYQNNKHKYTTTDNQDLILEPGQTWIAIFPRDRQNAIEWK